MELTEINYRRGRVIVSRDLFALSKEDFLKAVFSKFYPVAIEPKHDLNFYGLLAYYGTSPEFDILQDGEVVPEYNIVVKTEGEELIGVHFEKIK